MTDYARITTVDHTGKRQTRCYRVLSEGPVWLHALAVNIDGDDTESHYRGDGTLVVVEHLIQKETITKRVPLVMDLHYGQLKEAT